MVKKVKIDPKKLGITWSTSTNYRFELDAGFVREVGGNRSLSPATTSAYSFNTLQFYNPPPEIQRTTSPDPNGFIKDNLSFMPVVLFKPKNRGHLYRSTSSNLYLYSGTNLISTIPTTSTRLISSSTQVTLNLYGLVQANRTYSISGDAGAFTDLFDFPTLGFSNVAFTTTSILRVPDTYYSISENVSSIASSSTHIAIGTTQTQKTYVFSATTTSTIPNPVIKTFSDPNPRTGSQFGRSVAISDSYCVISDPAGGSSNSGAVYVYSNTSSSLLRTLNGSTNSGFGNKVKIFNDWLLIGSYNQSGGNIRLKQLSSSTFERNYGVGVSVESIDASDNYFIVGCNNKTAYVYSYTNTNLVYTFANTGSSPKNIPWVSVSINDSYAAVGVPGYAFNGTDQCGKVVVYNLSNGSVRYTIEGARSTPIYNMFGYTVKILGDKLYITERKEDFTSGGASYNDTGIVYVYNLSAGTFIESIVIPFVHYANGDEGFGTILTGQGNSLIIGYDDLKATKRCYKYTV